ncbi:MAG: hypothetical protein DRJ49_00375 [Thermoprotei archaeon]|nr:MAG: hypothetical protein DRJ49_00375 [Thermoprotei archaeon]
MLEVKFKAVLVSKTLITDPTGENFVKLEFVEEREVPGPIITMQGPQSELMREVIPVVSQVIRSLTARGRMRYPRLVLYLSEDEWSKLPRKPDIGDEIEVVIRGKEYKVDVNI